MCLSILNVSQTKNKKLQSSIFFSKRECEFLPQTTRDEKKHQEKDVGNSMSLLRFIYMSEANSG
jgi:hypothetical protein